MAKTKFSFGINTILLKSATILVIFVIAASFLYRITPIGILAQSSQSVTSLSDKTPNYFYNRESAFILQYGLDYNNGGMYLAVDKDGSPIDSIIPGEVWAYEANTLKGTDKTQVGQATCIRYFINEYLRVKENGIEGINNLLPENLRVTTTKQILEKAKICADFAINKMEIPSTVGTKDPALFPQDQQDTVNPNALYYWGVVSKDGSIRFDDSSPANTSETYRSETSLTWTFAELALAMKNNGFAQTEYQPYIDAALRWWNWRKDTARTLDENFDNGLTPGAGRDLYYPALGFVLTELTGDSVYRDGNGENNADGSQIGAIPFANSQLGTGTAPIIPFGEPENALQEKTYTAALPRGTIFAKHDKLFPGTLSDRDQWWDFGWDPLVQGGYLNYSIKPANTFTDAQLEQAFKHTGGRELLAGVLKSIWFYSTFGANPEMFYVKDTTDKTAFSQANFSTATKEYWDFLNLKLWDDTAGQAAWLEAINAPYKPCFSGDNDIPFGDWKSPVIGDKVHTLNVDNSATVTVSGVTDPSTPYLSMDFAGSGIKNVEVVYTTNKGQTWTTIPTTFNGTNHTSTIPQVDPGTTVYYYAKAVDNFNNWTAFPAGSETWNDSNNTAGQDYTKAQTYTIPALDNGFGGGSTNNDPQVSQIDPSKVDVVTPQFGFGGAGPTTSTSPAVLIRTGGSDK